MLTVDTLQTNYFHGDGEVPAVRGIDLHIEAGSATALVGESGCGKSTAALSIMRLVRPPIGKIVDGVVELDGRNLLSLSERDMRATLHDDIGYIPQDPTTSLDPLFTIRRQIAEAQSGRSFRDKEADDAIVAILDRLGMPDARARLRSFPHQFSGGMRQRVAIAVAIAKEPKLLIADEPTTALDVTTQLGILRLLDELRRDRRLAMLFVTHDLSVARLVCQNVAVMYAGIIVETGPIDEVLTSPLHPYTKALLDADPGSATPRTRLDAIPGQPPPLTDLPAGCPFAPRCSMAGPECELAIPPVETHGAIEVRCVKVGAP